MSLTIGSLFAGIGGLELGLERAGLGPVVWQVEKAHYARRVLAKHWPDATRYEDVRDVGGQNLAPVDVICGGFPCQPHSVAGEGAGLQDERYLWPEYARIIGELRPRFVVVENVANILADGTALRVLGDLAGIGYDAEWSTVSACSVGAAHTRERLFIVAYAHGQHGSPRIWAEFSRGLRSLQRGHGSSLPRANGFLGLEDQSRLYRVTHGTTDRVVRNHALGNAVVPQVAEVVGRVVLALDAELRGAA